jgi:hypothetical protein
VTATTGSASSDEVTTLRGLRERIRARSRLGGQLIDSVYEEYWRFSPPIAAELRDNPRELFLVLGHVVRPLFAWYTLAAALALDPDDAARQRAASEALAEERPHGGGELVLGLLETLRSGAPLPPDLPLLLCDLAPRIAEFRFASWAILDPLVRLWRGAGEGFDARGEIADWLAAAPLDHLPPCVGCGLASELETIAGFFAFAPDRRAVLGQRLRSAWPEAAGAIEQVGLTVQMERFGED